jgi:DNA-binding NarL/FixJ family response regulator
LNKTKLKVLIADVQDLFREILKVYLLKKGFYVVADVETGVEVITQTFACSPDIVLLDLELPILEGIRVAKIIKSVKPEIKIIAVTYCGDEYLYDNLTTFIDGYVKKPIDIEFMDDIIQRISKGEKGYFDNNKTSEDVHDEIAFGSKLIWNNMQFALTNQERNVLKCILSGMSNEKISKELFISVSTVKFHVRNILRKCDASNKLELTKKYGLR